MDADRRAGMLPAIGRQIWKSALQSTSGVMDAESLQTLCVVSWSTYSGVVPLSRVIEHFWGHMEGHLVQILGPSDGGE